MGAFEDVHRDRITGTLAMYDRVIFKGYLRCLYKQDGARCFLWSQGVALKDFTPYAKATTARIADNARRLATEAGRPIISFDHVKTRNRAQQKADLARSIAQRDGITSGIVCLISAVEPCMSYQVRKSFKTRSIQCYRRERRCLHHYLYLIDDEFGFMHPRIQGWIPYDCQIYINGREWLARQLDRARIGYVRHDNSLLRVDDLARAQRLCARFAHRSWPRVLNNFARRINPLLPTIRRAGYGSYYWVTDQTEIATDVMFATRAALLEVWPDLVHHAALNMSSAEVLGFPGRKMEPSLAEVISDSRRRQQGWRVRHRLGPNWVKVYDKASVLRVETVLNNPREFRILRLVTDERGRRERRWCQMRKSVHDMWRNYEVGVGSNARYLEALAAAPLKGKGVAALDALCRPRTNRGRTHARFSRLNPKDQALFRAALAGEHNIVGFRNHELAARLYRRTTIRSRRGPPPPRTGVTAHRQAPGPRPHRQGAPISPLSRHPLRPKSHDRGHRRPQRSLSAQVTHGRVSRPINLS